MPTRKALCHLRNHFFKPEAYLMVPMDPGHVRGEVELVALGSGWTITANAVIAIAAGSVRVINAAVAEVHKAVNRLH